MTSEPNRLRNSELAVQARAWMPVLVRYRTSDPARGVVELAITALPLCGLWAVAWLAYRHGAWWATFLLAIPAAGFFVRLFVILHDCGHGSFFPNRIVNDWVGRAIGILMITPYDFWRRTHAIHHSNSGNLDRRGVGDVDTLTVNEFVGLSRWGRLKYRLYRSAFIQFGLGPGFIFLVYQRVPVGFLRSGWGPWISTQATNGAIAAIVILFVGLIGFKAVLAIYLPTMLIATSIGGWLFFVQHQFKDTYWSEGEGWGFHKAALHGSSHYDLPLLLRWFTANIGVHHVHHLCSMIPSYNLARVLREHPELARIGRITLRESLRCVPLALWDDELRRLVSFKCAARNADAHCHVSIDPSGNQRIAISA